MKGLLNDDREQYAAGKVVKKLIAEYNKRKKIVSEEYDPAYAKTEELTREVTPAEAKKLLDVIGKQGGAENTIPYQLGGIEGTIDRVFESELAMVAGGNKPQKLKSFWLVRDASADDDFMVSNMPLNKIIDDIVGRKDIDPRKPMTQKEIDSELAMMTERGDFVDGGLLQDDRQKYANPKGDVKDEDGFLGHLDGVSAKTVDDIVEGDIAAVLEVAEKFNMDVDGLIMEAKIERTKRKNYSIGGIIAKLAAKHEKKLIKENPIMDDLEQAQRQLDFFDYEQAKTMVLSGDMTIAEANRTLKSVGYDEKDIQEFTRAISTTKEKPIPPKPSLARDAVKMAEDKRSKDVLGGKMTQEEIDEALDRLTARGDFYSGGLLADDRQAYSIGKIVSKMSDLAMEKIPGADVLYDNASIVKQKLKGDMSTGEMIKTTESMFKDSLKNYGNLKAAYKNAANETDKVKIQNQMKVEIDQIKKLGASLEKLGINISPQNIKEEVKSLRTKKAEGGEMTPDAEMESDYLDFILDEALTDEEEEMLMSKLEQDEQMAMLFDKVVDVAQEFAGSGPVEGPGSGVSDSIPARLSDGEFVFTAAAVEEIGADKLMAMMKDAEASASKKKRQGLAEGGMSEEDTVVMTNPDPVKQEIRVVKATVDNSGRGLLDEDEISKDIKSNMMLDPTQRHVRS